MSFCNIFTFLRHLVQEKNWAASGGQGGGGIKTALLGGVCFWALGGGVPQEVPIRAPIYVADMNYTCLIEGGIM